MRSLFATLRSWSDLVRLYRITASQTPLNLQPRYNIAPTQQLPVFGTPGKAWAPFLPLPQITWCEASITMLRKRRADIFGKAPDRSVALFRSAPDIPGDQRSKYGNRAGFTTFGRRWEGPATRFLDPVREFSRKSASGEFGGETCDFRVLGSGRPIIRA